MPTNVSIDATASTVTLRFVDDKGDTDAAAPEGAVVTYGSDNPTVATVDPTSGHITPVAEGTANATVTIADASGNPVLEPDGVTAFSALPVPFTIVAGAAESAELVVAP